MGAALLLVSALFRLVSNFIGLISSLISSDEPSRSAGSTRRGFRPGHAPYRVKQSCWKSSSYRIAFRQMTGMSYIQIHKVQTCSAKVASSAYHLASSERPMDVLRCDLLISSFRHLIKVVFRWHPIMHFVELNSQTNSDSPCLVLQNLLVPELPSLQQMGSLAI